MTLPKLGGGSVLGTNPDDVPEQAKDMTEVAYLCRNKLERL
jgi:hypothetical protein